MQQMIYSLLIITTMLISCSQPEKPQPAPDPEFTPQEIARTNVEAHIQNQLHDASSYEFISLSLVDSITYQDNVEFRIKMFSTNLRSDSMDLTRIRDYKSSLPALYNQSDEDRALASIKKNQEILSGIDSIKASISEQINDVASYTYLYKFRAKNAFGAVVMNEYYIQLNSDLTVKHMAASSDKLLLNPNEFPGYKEMASRIYSRYR